MTPEQIDARRLEIQEAHEARARIEHDNALADRVIRNSQREREVQAIVQQAANNARMADGMVWNNRIGLILDAAIKRIDDRTSTTGAVNIPKAVTEAMDTLAEIERRLAPTGGLS